MQVQDYDHSFIVDRISVWVLVLIDMMLPRIFCWEIFISSVSKHNEKSWTYLLMLFAFFSISLKLKQSFYARANSFWDQTGSKSEAAAQEQELFTYWWLRVVCVPQLCDTAGGLSKCHHILPGDLCVDLWSHRDLPGNESPFLPRDTHQC